MDIEKIKKEIENIFLNDSSGHDYWHTMRVYKNAMQIADGEECNVKLVELAALLHDVDDPKLFLSSDHENARNIMERNDVNSQIQKEVVEIIRDISYRGKDSIVPKTIEGKIVQDADRLDALGAIGIARTFAYGGCKGRKIYDPMVPPITNMSEDDYLENDGTSINHFYEKLLRLTQMMNTNYARGIAEKREAFMKVFLKEFLSEWEGI